MTIVPGPLASAAPADGGPREYNFAADILERNLRAGRAHKPAYVDPRGSWSFGQLADRAARFGQALRALGVRREERILLCLLDTIDWPTAFLGAIKTGVIPIPVNTLMTEDDYRFMLADSRARALVVSAAIYPKFENLIKSTVDLQLVIVSGDEAHGHHGFEDLIARAKPEAYTAPTTQDDVCFCEGFRMTAHCRRGGWHRGRRSKASREGTRGGLCRAAVPRYGDLAAVD